MPTRVMSYHGYFAATAWCQRMRSGKPASARFFQATSWNALDRLRRPHAVDLHHDEAELRHAPAGSARRRTSWARRSPAGRRRSARSPGTSSRDRSSIGRTMMPQMSVLPSRAFGDEHLGRAPAGGEQRRHVALLERHHERLSAVRCSSVTGGRSTRE